MRAQASLVGGLLVGWGLLAAAVLAAGEAPGEPRFLILIHGDDAPAAEQAAVVDQYRQWANRLIGEGRLVAAGELAGSATVVDAGTGEGAATRAGEPSAQGYFLVTAPDLAAAVALARDCPALRRGGRVEVVPEVQH